MSLPLPTTNTYANGLPPTVDQDFLNQLDWLINNFYAQVNALIAASATAAFSSGSLSAGDQDHATDFTHNIVTHDFNTVTSALNNNSWVRLNTPPYKSRCIIAAATSVEFKIYPSQSTTITLPDGTTQGSYQLYPGSTVAFQYDENNLTWRALSLGLRGQPDVNFKSAITGDMLVWNGSNFLPQSQVGIAIPILASNLRITSAGNTKLAAFDVTNLGFGTTTYSFAPSSSDNTLVTVGTISGYIPNGSITNAKLASASITLGSTAVALGGTAGTINGLALTGGTTTTVPASGGALTNRTYVDAQDATVLAAAEAYTDTNAGTIVKLEISPGDIAIQPSGSIWIRPTEMDTTQVGFYRSDGVAWNLIGGV